MANDSQNNRSGDMILAPNQFIHVRDDTKGHVDVFIGPAKVSLSNTDQPVVFDEGISDWREASPSEARQVFLTAPEGSYIILRNPAESGKQPESAGKVGNTKLRYGKQINIPGTAHFALWPEQVARVLEGHRLRSNQYLIVQVIDEEQARKNWESAIVKRAAPEKPSSAAAADKTPEEDPGKAPAKEGPDPAPVQASPSPVDGGDLTMGQLLVIKGTDVSFYIPPTGMEVVPDADGKLVREAVTLERLEYCLLLDEDGNKRYERGPAVVFPRPTEIFANADDESGIPEENAERSRKFRAIELNETQGLYIKVIADYEEDGEVYKTGQELFITGKEQMIYFPREEHAIIKYDGQEKHFGIAIPAGEGRYVLDRATGIVSIQDGPCIFLPDPRKHVIIRRVLDYQTCNLLYPGNNAAIAHNAAALGLDVATYMSQKDAAPAVLVAGATGPQGPIGTRGPVGAAYASSAPLMAMESEAYYSANAMRLGDSAEARGLSSRPGHKFSGHAFERKTKQQPPRTLTLTTKFDGAVSVKIYTGYAILLVRSDGRRRVVQGPKTVMLEYDELPEVIAFSTGKPKTTDNMARDVYLRVRNNKVSDIVSVETRDFCTFKVKMSYRMNFEGDPNSWFDVENYVKFMCDNIRSRLKGAVRQYGVEEFYARSTEIVRDVVLGEADEESEERTGLKFEENGMHVYDVEVLGVELEDRQISELIVTSQRNTIETTLRLQTQRRNLEVKRETERISQETADLEAATKEKTYSLQKEDAEKKLVAELATINALAEAAKERVEKQLEQEKGQTKVAEEVRARKAADTESEIDLETKRQQVKIALIEAEVQALAERAKAITPDMIAALDTFGHRVVAEKMVEAMAPMSLLGGSSVADIVGRVFAGTPLAKALTNGSSPEATSRSQASARS